MIFFARSSTRWVELQKIIDWLIWKKNKTGGLKTNLFFTQRTSLTNLQFGEECVETVDLLPLLNESIVLGDSLECELVHEVDLVRRAHVLLHEGFDRERERGVVEEDLTRAGQVGDETVQHPLEVLGEQLVGLV